jgi:hypothetical protein
MTQKVLAAGLAAALTVMGCSTSNVTSTQTKWTPTYRMQAGLNKGGITENTDLTVVPNAQVDAYSGATKTGMNMGARVILPVKRNAFETGVDYMFNSQTFTYRDAANGFSGTRKLGVSQIMVPVTYSIGLFRKNHAEGLFQLKVGYMAQLNLFSVSNGNGNLPSFSTKPFSNGAIVGLSATPLRLSNGAKLGFYIEGYRGSRAYEDFYNRREFEMPGTSFVKYGVIYQF